MAWNDIDLGAVSAYAVAVENGYQGTPEEWARDQAYAAKNAQDARKAAEGAKSSEVAAKNALDALLSKQESAIGAIGAEAATQVGNVNAAGAVQVQAVRDAGKEQADGLAALGATERGKVAAAGDEQVARVEQAGNAAEESAIEAIRAERGSAVALVQNEGAAQAETVRQAGDQVQASIPKDYTALASAVDSLQKGKAPAIECEATGSIVTITDGAAMPVVRLVSHIEPVQAGSGEPSPDNVRPISGWDSVSLLRVGANLASKVENAGIASGRVFISNSRRSIVVEVKGGYTYTIKRNSIEANNLFRACFTAQKPTGTSSDIDNGSPCQNLIVADTETTITLTAPETANWLYVYVDNDTLEVDLSKYTISVGETATAYEPYNGQTLTAELPETVFGGELDWNTGLLIVNSGIRVYTGEESDIIYNSKNAANNIGSVVSNNEQTTRIVTDIISNLLPTEVATGKQGVRCRPADNGIVIQLKFETDVSGLNQTEVVNTIRAWLAEKHAAGTPLTVVYKLAEPYTIQLTPQQLDTLRGTNNIWSNCGDTKVNYIAYTEDWSKNAATSMIGAVENGMVATKNYAIGSFIVVKDALTMYRATAAIANGEAIKPGTNCVATTVAEQLANLYSLINA